MKPTEHPDAKALTNNGLRAIWITPIRALSKEIEISAKRLIAGLDIDMTVGVRSGDTSLKERMRQKTKPPHVLITTPESLHLLLAQRSYATLFKDLKVLVADDGSPIEPSAAFPTTRSNATTLWSTCSLIRARRCASPTW